MEQTVASQFYQQWRPKLEPFAKKYGINPDYLVAQLAQESMWGTITPRGSHNYAGIHEFRKGRQGVTARDAGNLRKFRKYDDDNAFAEDYVKLMARLYPDTAKATTFNEFATALQNGKGGRKWAESPTYVKDLNTVWDKSLANVVGQAGSPSQEQTEVQSRYTGDNMPQLLSGGALFNGKQEQDTVSDPYTKLYASPVKVEQFKQPTYKSEFKDGYQPMSKEYKLWGI